MNATTRFESNVAKNKRVVRMTSKILSIVM